MLAVREEAEEGKILLSPPTASMKTVVPSPMVAAAAGTLIYLNSYGITEAPAEALSLDEEVDYMPDGNIIISQPFKGSKRPNNPKQVKAQQRRRRLLIFRTCQVMRYMTVVRSLIRTSVWQQASSSPMTETFWISTLIRMMR